MFIGVLLNLVPSHVMILKEAALLHDIGKIGIPEHVLNKQQRLSEKEANLVHKHVEMSITTVKHLPSQSYVLSAVLGHHERWDGKGYPRGLAIADAFDAMTSDRPYSKGRSAYAALQEIERHAGT